MSENVSIARDLINVIDDRFDINIKDIKFATTNEAEVISYNKVTGETIVKYLDDIDTQVALYNLSGQDINAGDVICVLSTNGRNKSQGRIIANVNNRSINLGSPSFSDFYHLNTTQGAFSLSAINTGTIGLGAPSGLHQGVATLFSSTAANSGYSALTSTGAILLSGNEEFKVVFRSQTASPISYRLGFFDSANTTITDGVLVTSSNGILTGNTYNNGSTNATNSSYIMTNATWYRLKITLNSNASSVTFTLYADNSNTVLWTDTISSNIPTGSGRYTGCGCTAISSGTSVITLMDLDYMSINTPNARII